jgi:hypothetical protein
MVCAVGCGRLVRHEPIDGNPGHLSDYKANIHNKITAIPAPGSGDLGNTTATVNDLRRELSTSSETAEDKKIGRNARKQPIAV